MFPSILITGSDYHHRLLAADEQIQTKLTSGPDTLILEPNPSITIANVRQLTHFLSRKPYLNPVKIALITAADLLTLPAQQALLKILEEPPKNSIIILLSPNPNSLLETILSRCQHIRLKVAAPAKSDAKEFWQQITHASPGKRLSLASSFNHDKTTALNFCLEQLNFLRPKLGLETSPSLLRQISLSYRYLQANVNPKLVIENLLLSYPFAKLKDSL